MSKCSCIKGRFDFNLQIVGKSQILITDLSDWMETAPYALPTEWEIEIKKKGETTGVKALIQPKGSVAYKLSDLGINDCDNGFYEISTSGCYNCIANEYGEKKYTKTKLIAPSLQCQLDNLLGTSDDTDAVMKLHSKLNMAKCIAELGQCDKAQEILDIINKETKKYDCNTCGC